MNATWLRHDQKKTFKKERDFCGEYSLSTSITLSKYGVFSGPYFSAFSPNTRKYGLERTPYLDTFHVVLKMRRKMTEAVAQSFL